MRLEIYLNEESERIYFGHPRMTYGTELEKKAINIIKKKFPSSTIFNPGNIDFGQFANDPKAKEMKHFIKFTDDCNVGVFLTLKNNVWSQGIWKEALRMLKKKKPVFLVDLKKNVLKIIKNASDIKKMKHLTIKDTIDMLAKAGFVIGENDIFEDDVLIMVEGIK